LTQVFGNINLCLVR